MLQQYYFLFYRKLYSHSIETGISLSLVNQGFRRVIYFNGGFFGGD
jgi:hypothetical protein